MLSNVYLHYVLDLWFERVVKPRLRGAAHMIRYIDDFVMCFQYREDALRVEDALCKRLGKFGLTLEPTKTKLVEFGRFAQRHAAKHGRKRPETIYFLGFTLYCTRNLKGNFRIGMRTEKSRLRRSLMSLQDLLRRIRHWSVREQVNALNGRTEGPLRLLRHCRKLSFPAKGPSGGRTLLAQNAVQPELGRAHHVGHVPPDQTAATDLATKAVPSLSGVTSSRSAVNHLLKSVVREIRTLRSVGTGGGRPPPVTRWACSNGRTYRDPALGSQNFDSDQIGLWK